MSREAYKPPTLTPQPSSSAFTQQAGASSSNAAGASYTTGAYAAVGGTGGADTSKPVTYTCGECNSKVSLRRQDPIRCKECGHRVLYKERTNRMVQFEAR